MKIRKLGLLFLFLAFMAFMIFRFGWTQLLDWQESWMLWKANSKEAFYAGFHGFEKNPCKDKFCQCVLLLHDLGDNAKTWKALFHLDQQDWEQAGLKEPPFLLALDLTGHGKTPVIHLTHLQMTVQLTKLSEILSQFPQCSSWLGVGHGWGGNLLLNWSDSRMSKRLLIAPIALAFQWEKSLDNWQGWFSQKDLGWQDQQIKGYARPKKLLSGFWKDLAQKRESQKWVILKTLEQNKVTESPYFVQKPTYLLWGKLDFVEPIEQGYALRSFLRTAIWREFPGCGHYLQRECASGVIASLVDLIRFGQF